MNRKAPTASVAVSALFLLFCQSSARRGDSTEIEGKVHLDRQKSIDFTVSRPTLVVVQDTVPLRLLEQYAEATRKGKVRTNAADHVLDPESRYFAAICSTSEMIPLECIDRAIMDRKPELVLVVRNFRTDKGTVQYSHTMRTPGADGTLQPGPDLINWRTEFRTGAEILLFDRRTGRILFHADLVGEGPTGSSAREKLAEYVVKWVPGVFRPDWPLESRRNRVGINPAGFVTGPLDPKVIHFSYERLLGSGRNSLAVTTSFHAYTNDQRKFWYLHLPSVGLRHYFRREGSGFWLGGKLGYIQIENTWHDVWYGRKDTMEVTRGRVAALSLELGFHTLPVPKSSLLNRFGLYGLVGLGAGIGWTDIGTDMDMPERARRDKGFGWLPTYEAAAGLSCVF